MNIFYLDSVKKKQLKTIYYIRILSPARPGWSLVVILLLQQAFLVTKRYVLKNVAFYGIVGTMVGESNSKTIIFQGSRNES